MKDLPLQDERVLASRPRRLIAGIVWAVLLAGGLLFLSRASLLPEGPDEWTVDWRTLLFSQTTPEQRDDIAVILVNEKSIAKYPYLSPVNRSFLAELVTAIAAAKPKAIGIDFIFDRATESERDETLISALKALKATDVPVVLAAIDERSDHILESSVSFQEDLLKKTGLAAGHIYFALQEDRLTIGDQVVRFFADASPNPPRREAFARLLAEVDGPKPQPASNYIAWLLHETGGAEDTFATFRIPTYDPEAGKPILPPDFVGAIKGKIVLIGGDFIDRDKHLTPLSVASGTKVPGVLIHAQILAQMIDGRSITLLSDVAEFLALAIVAAVGFFLGWRWQLQQYGWIVYASGVGVLGILGALLFWQYKILIPSTTLFLAWVTGVFGGYYSDRLLGALSERLGRSAS